MLGDCKFTTANKQDCRYSHNVKNTQAMKVWRKYHIDALTKNPAELLQLLQEKKRQEDLSNSDEEEYDDDEEEEEEEEEEIDCGRKSNEV